jgi:hypothetical protein
MDPALKDAIITFLRGAFAAGVAAALVYVGGVDLSAVVPMTFAKEVGMAFIAGVLLFLGAWARNATTEPIPPMPMGAPSRRADGTVVPVAGAHRNRTRSWADVLPI